MATRLAAVSRFERAGSPLSILALLLGVLGVPSRLGIDADDVWILLSGLGAIAVHIRAAIDAWRRGGSLAERVANVREVAESEDAELEAAAEVLVRLAARRSPEVDEAIARVRAAALLARPARALALRPGDRDVADLDATAPE